MSNSPVPSARVVVVGGREDDRRTLETLLRGAGLADVFFASSAEALSDIGARTVDLLVVDVMLPGDEVLQLLRAATPAETDTHGHHVPVLVLAPANANNRVQACLQRGADDFVTTPLDPTNGMVVTRRFALALERRRLREFTVRLRTTAKDAEETAVLQLYTDASSRFVPREFLELLERKTLADVRLGDHVEREMTVLFSDIRDFTALSEQLTPRQNFEFLNSYLQNVTPIIRAHRGFVDKYIGDAIMALYPRNPSDALRSALDVLREVKRYNAGRKLAGYVPIKIGIGMHTGNLILGTIGEDERMQTTVIADAVNVASRIEGLTKTFGVPLLVSGSVVSGFENAKQFKMRALGAVKAKGKTQSVEIFECYDLDSEEQIALKDKTLEAFEAAMAEFRKGMFITAGRLFSRIAEINPLDSVANFYRDRCTLTAVRDRGAGVWDGAEKIEIK